MNSDVTVPLRIAAVNPPLDYSGGMGRVLQRDLEDFHDAPEVALTYVDSRGSGSKLGSLWIALRAALQLRRAITKGEIDLVHLNLSIRLSVVRKFLIAAVARQAGAATVLHFHGGEFPAFFAGLPRPLQWLVRRQLRAATGIITLAQVWTDYLVDLGIPREQLTEVPNGSPGPDTPPQRSVAAPVQLLYAGRVTTDKGAADLIPLVLAVRAQGVDADLVVAGDGPAEAEIRAAAAAAGVSDHIRLLGWVDSATLQAEYVNADVFILPSYFENQPSSILEAMALGLPCVGTTVGAIPEQLDEGAGLTFTPGDIAAGAAAIVTLVEPDTYAAASAAAFSRWQEHYTQRAHRTTLLAAWQYLATRHDTALRR